MPAQTTQTTVTIAAALLVVASCSMALFFMVVFGWRGSSWGDPAYAGLPTRPPAMRTREMQMVVDGSFLLASPCRQFNHWARVTLPSLCAEFETTGAQTDPKGVFFYRQLATTLSALRCAPGTLVTNIDGSSRTPSAVLQSVKAALAKAIGQSGP